VLSPGAGWLPRHVGGRGRRARDWRWIPSRGIRRIAASKPAWARSLGTGSKFRSGGIFPVFIVGQSTRASRGRDLRAAIVLIRPNFRGQRLLLGPLPLAMPSVCACERSVGVISESAVGHRDFGSCNRVLGFQSGLSASRVPSTLPHARCGATSLTAVTIGPRARHGSGILAIVIKNAEFVLELPSVAAGHLSRRFMSNRSAFRRRRPARATGSTMIRCGRSTRWPARKCHFHHRPAEMSLHGSDHQSQMTQR
jgi:hypothetical protein